MLEIPQGLQRGDLPALPLSLSGAVGDGVTDDTTALNAFLTANPGKRYYVDRTFAVSNVVTVPSSSEMFGPGGFVMLNPDVSCIRIIGSRVRLRDFTITCATAGTTAYIGGVLIDSSVSGGGTDNLVERIQISGVSWAGILLWGGSRNRMIDCEISGHRGTLQDSAGVCAYRDS